MLTSTLVHVCARCGSERSCKNGHADNGAQRAKCLERGRTFILEPAGPRYDDAFREAVVRAYGAAFPAGTHRFCGKEEGETNQAERCFGTLRARLSRLVRKTYSFSKYEDRYAQAIHLFIVNHNLAIQRQSTTI